MTAAVDYERLLADEGLSPVNGSQVISLDETGLDAADAWTAWARDVLRTHAFASREQREIWKLYADGLSVADISERLGKAARGIKWHVAQVKGVVGLPPVENPWKKRREHRVREQHRAPVRPGLLARFAKLALRCCDVGLLLELAHDDPELLQLLPKGDDMAEEKKKSAPGAVTYTRIKFRGGQALQVPGVSVHKDILTKVSGRPHAGGIDVTFAIPDGGAKIVTVPWWRIDFAERAAGGEE